MTTLQRNATRVVTLATTWIGLLILGGCATDGTPTSSQAEPVPAVLMNAFISPASKTSGPQGTVIFFRDKKFIGSATSFKVREADQELGRLSKGTYFSVNLPVGAHAFGVTSEDEDVLSLGIEKGQTYYVQGTIGFGVLMGQVRLTLSDAATFQRMKDNLKDSAAEDAKREAQSNKRKSIG